MGIHFWAISLERSGASFAWRCLSSDCEVDRADVLYFGVDRVASLDWDVGERAGQDVIASPQLFTDGGEKLCDVAHDVAVIGACGGRVSQPAVDGQATLQSVGIDCSAGTENEGAVKRIGDHDPFKVIRWSTDVDDLERDGRPGDRGARLIRAGIGRDVLSDQQGNSVSPRRLGLSCAV